MSFLILVYFFLFVYLSLKNLKLGVYLFLLFLPSYFIKVSIFGLPSTILEITFFAIVLAWLPEFLKNDWRVFRDFVQKNKIFILAVGLFLIFSFIAVLNNQFLMRGLGHWRAYFLEPIIFFVILISQSDKIGVKGLLKGLLLASLPVSLLAVFQMFTGKLIYTPEWSALATRRATAFFTSPNAVALFLEMIFVMSGIYYWQLRKTDNKKEKYFGLTIFVLAGLGILFSFSQGSWLALFVGILVFLFLMQYKKLFIILSVLAVFGVFLFPSIKEVVMFADKAGQNRIILWQKTQEYLFSTPRRFILGTGLRRFYGEIQKPLANKVMEPLIYPHNIILNFWSEIGLFGLLSFLVIYLFLLKESLQIWNRQNIFGLGLLIAWLVFFIHGLVDVPYFKNDLSFLFWIFASLTFYFNYEKT